MKFLNSDTLLDVLVELRVLSPKQRQFVILEKASSASDYCGRRARRAMSIKIIPIWWK